MMKAKQLMITTVAAVLALGIAVEGRAEKGKAKAPIVGGFLGMGDRKVAVPATLIESDAEGRMVLPGATADQLKALPEFRYAE